MPRSKFSQAIKMLAGLFVEDVMVCCNNVGIEDESMESACCYCDMEEEEQDD